MISIFVLLTLLLSDVFILAIPTGNAAAFATSTTEVSLTTPSLSVPGPQE